MSFLPTVILPNGRERGRNIALDAIALRLRDEGNALLTLAAELEARDVLEAGAVAPLVARLGGTATQITVVETEVSAPTSIALVSQPDRKNWVPVVGGIDRL